MHFQEESEMKRFAFLLTLAAACGLAAPGPAAEKATRPNVVFILPDDK